MSSMIKILNQSLVELATITVASSAVRTEKINCDNILNFSIRTKDPASAHINENNIAELDGDYFDIVYYKKEQQSDGKLIVTAECEHVSYRLNEETVDTFTEIGTPAEVLSAILSGTGFTVGTVNFTEAVTFSLQQAASRRALLMQFAAYVEGELEFDGFEISLLTQRGSSTPKALTVGKDITVISKAVNKRVLDAEGNPQISYACGVYKGAELALGDVVTLNYSALDISASLRVVSKSYDPYNPNNVAVEIGNFINALEDDIYRIQTTTVVKDKLYHGCRIGPQNGFECIRSDKKARAYLNSTNLALQAGDGTGENWRNKLYYDLDPETGEAELYFGGKFNVEAVASNAAILQVLYATEGRIARLTVDRLLSGNPLLGTEYIYFISIREQYQKFIIGHRTAVQEQYTNEAEQPFFWNNESQEYMTTINTGIPVMVYVYDLTTKLEMNFERDSTGTMVPKIILGAGIGSEDYPERGKGYIYKETDGLLLKYVQADGGILSVKLGEDGAVIDPPLFIFPENKNIDQIVATTETALPGMEITLKENAKVKFTAQMDVTASEAMTLLVKARIDGTEHRHTVKYFAGAYKDGLCFSGLFDAVTAGTHVIDMSITPSAGTATIAAEEYHLVLTIENAISVIDYTQHQRWEDYPETPDVLIEYPYQAVIEVDYAYGELNGIWFRPINITCYYPDNFPETWPITDFSRAFLMANNYNTINESMWTLVQVPDGKNIYRYYDSSWSRWQLKFTTRTNYDYWRYDASTKTWTYYNVTGQLISERDNVVAYYPLNIYNETSLSTVWRVGNPIQTELIGKGYGTLEAFYTGYAGADYKLLILSKDLIWAETVSTNKEFRTGAGNDVADREYFKLYRLVSGAWVPHETYPNIYALRLRTADLTGGYVRVVELNTPVYDGFAGIASNTKLYEKTT